jgi:CRP-like cAMP-binding protein
MQDASVSGLPFDVRSLLATPGEGRTISKYRLNQSIIRQGDASDSVFYVLQGKVKKELLTDEGRQAVLAILGPDEFFGFSCLVTSSVRRFSVCAITPCMVARLEKSFVQRMFKQHPQFADFFVTYLVRLTMHMQEDIINHLINDSRKRLARLLLLLAYDQQVPSETISPHISHELLAEMVGTTRPRINEFMNEFRRLGHIEYNAHRNLRVRSSLAQVLLNY